MSEIENTTPEPTTDAVVEPTTPESPETVVEPVAEVVEPVVEPVAEVVEPVAEPATEPVAQETPKPTRARRTKAAAGTAKAAPKAPAAPKATTARTTTRRATGTRTRTAAAKAAPAAPVVESVTTPATPEPRFRRVSAAEVREIVAGLDLKALKETVTKVDLPTVAEVRERIGKVELPTVAELRGRIHVDVPATPDWRAEADKLKDTASAALAQVPGRATDLVAEAQVQARQAVRKALAVIK